MKTNREMIIARRSRVRLSRKLGTHGETFFGCIFAYRKNP